jgi:hypothetical protein
LADAGEVTVSGDGDSVHAGTSRQAWVVSARVWQEAVGLGDRVAAETAQDIADLAETVRANPIVVVIGGVVHEGAVWQEGNLTLGHLVVLLLNGLLGSAHLIFKINSYFFEK